MENEKKLKQGAVSNHGGIEIIPGRGPNS